MLGLLPKLPNKVGKHLIPKNETLAKVTKYSAIEDIKAY